MNQYINDGSNNPGESTTGSYYKTPKRKSYVGFVIGLLIFLLIGVLVIVYGGFFKAPNNTTVNNTMIDKLCNISINYVKNNKISGYNVPDKVIYVTINNLISAGLIDASTKDILHRQNIGFGTDIRMIVGFNGDITCNGFAWPRDDRTIPVIELKGNATETLSVGTTYNDLGATATDNFDGDISDKIMRSGSVNLNAAGTYYIYYVVKDRAGNLSKTVTRTIIVQ